MQMLINRMLFVYTRYKMKHYLCMILVARQATLVPPSIGISDVAMRYGKNSIFCCAVFICVAKIQA